VLHLATRMRAIPYTGPTSSQLINGIEDPINGYRTDGDTTIWNSPSLQSRLSGTQITVSENHPSWRTHKSGSFKGDLGGPFFTQKRYVESISDKPLLLEGRIYEQSQNKRWLWHKYVGPLLPVSPSSMVFPEYGHSSTSDLVKLGTTAISRCSPSAPAADLTVMIGELVREGLPHALGSTLKSWLNMSNRQRRRAVGHEYLNFDFGWKPLVNDLQKLADAVTKADKILAQYQKDAGKAVRRKFEFPSIDTSTFSRLNIDGYPWVQQSTSSMYLPGINKGGYCALEKSVHQRRWFSGAFLYVLPGVNAHRNEIAFAVIQAKKLLGLSLTPDTLWSLAPWSWALDWFANTGDMLENLSNSIIDGQVLLYGYMMEHTIARNTYTWVGPTGMVAGRLPYSVSLVSETKQRIQATPYGFGIDWKKLSPRQLATIASLGLSKS
jgi:hypothetical protein